MQCVMFHSHKLILIEIKKKYSQYYINLKSEETIIAIRDNIGDIHKVLNTLRCHLIFQKTTTHQDIVQTRVGCKTTQKGKRIQKECQWCTVLEPELIIDVLSAFSERKIKCNLGKFRNCHLTSQSYTSALQTNIVCIGI